MGRYGNNKYKVENGSIWEFEKGLLVCGSNQDTVIRDVIPNNVGCVYTDPPWSQGNMRMFYNFASRPLDENFHNFSVNVATLIASKVVYGGWVFIEAGMDTYQEILEIYIRSGFVSEGVFKNTYGNPTRPNALLAMRNGAPINSDSRLLVKGGKHGVDAIHEVVFFCKNIHAGSMFDPCCGKLDFLIAGLKQGIDVYGIELIPNKLALGINRLEKLGYRVRRVG